MSQLNFTTSDEYRTSNDGDFTPIPNGWYEVQIIMDEWKHSRKGGRYLNQSFEVLGPSYAGRRVWHMLNLENDNPKTVEIAHSQLQQMCDALGIEGTVSDSEELHFKPMMARIVIEKQEGYKFKNVIKGFKARGNGQQRQAAPKKQPPKQATGKKQPPWGEKKAS